MSDLPELMDAKELAEALGLGRWRIYELARRGQIPCLRVGGSIRFDVEKVEAWLRAGGTPSMPEPGSVDGRKQEREKPTSDIYRGLYRDAEKEIAQLRATIEVLRGELQARLLEEGVTEEELATKMERFG